MRSWFAAGIILAAFSGSALADVVPLAPGAPIDGRSPSDVTAEWWKWSKAWGNNGPVDDLTGVRCADGQRGNVWFLAGGFGSARISRSCVLPRGKILFFPLVNMAYWPAHAGSRDTCADLKTAAALNNASAIDLFAEVDGAGVPEPARFRVATTECFDIFERAAKGTAGLAKLPAASDGFWIALPPLAPGRHVLRFGGRYNRLSGAYGRMVQDIEYTLDVQ